MVGYAGLPVSSVDAPVSALLVSPELRLQICVRSAFHEGAGNLNSRPSVSKHFTDSELSKTE